MRLFAIFVLHLSMILPASAQLREFKSQDALQLVLNSPQLFSSLNPKKIKINELSLSVSTQGRKFNKQFIVRVSQSVETSAGRKTCRRNIYVSPLIEQKSDVQFKLQSRLSISQVGPADCELPQSLAATQ